MSTTYGNGQGIDINCYPEAILKTTTSQFKVVSMVGATTTTKFTVGLAGQTGTSGTPTAAAYHAIGINQSYLSAGSEVCSVRMIGLSKAVCAASISAGQWVEAYSGASTTTRAGQIQAVANGVTYTALSLTSHRGVLGRALVPGSTNTVISVFLIPQLYDKALVAE